MYRRMLSAIHGFYPLDASSTLSPGCDTKNVSRHSQMSSEGRGKITPTGEPLR